MEVCACACMGACVYADSNPHVDVTGELHEEGGVSHGNWECQAFYLWHLSLCSSPRCGHPLSDPLLGTQGVCGPADILGTDDPRISPALPGPSCPFAWTLWQGCPFLSPASYLPVHLSVSLWPAAATVPPWALQSKDPRSWAFLKVEGGFHWFQELMP